MPILKKDVSSVAPAPLPLRTEGPLTKDQSIARSVAINNTFGAGWFKDAAQVMPLDEAVKKAFDVASQIETWLTR